MAFKVGDLVQLKSGSPIMTVISGEQMRKEKPSANSLMSFVKRTIC
jgi:Uncharacterized small protein (DUF2158)